MPTKDIRDAVARALAASLFVEGAVLTLATAMARSPRRAVRRAVTRVAVAS